MRTTARSATADRQAPAATHKHQSEDEAAVRRVIDVMAGAVRRKDVEAMVELCAPEIRTFDTWPPLQHIGATAVRETWERSLGGFEGPVEYEVHRLDVAVSGDIAFSRSINRFAGTKTDGERVESWLCMTLGFGKAGRDWKLLHQHASVPYDADTGRALLDLHP